MTVVGRLLRPGHSRSLICLSLALLLLIACRGGNALLDESAFSAAFVEALLRDDPTLRARIEAPLHVSVTSGEGSDYAAFLDNAYASYRNSPEALAVLLADHVASTRESVAAGWDGSFDIARVMPVIKDAAYPARAAADLAALNDGRQVQPYHERLNEELVVLFVEDREQSIAYLDEEAVAELGLSATRLRERAVDNLMARIPPPRIQAYAGSFTVEVDGFYETSLLVVDSVWTAEKFPVQGDIVVAVPSRGLLVVAGSEDPAMLALLREMAIEMAASEPYAISKELFVRRQGTWQRLAL